MKNVSLWVTVLLVLSGTVAAAGETPIAEVYGKKVYPRDVQLPQQMLETNKKGVSTGEYAKWKQDGMRQMLAYEVMEEARKRFLKEQGLEPTQQEIDSYIDFLYRSAEADRKRRMKERARLKKQLKQPELSEEKRKVAQTNLSILDEIDSYNVRPKSDRERRELTASERTVAKMFVSAWKFNQGLYRKYGGRVVFQQAGLEPIDAKKAFMKELVTSGAYKIVDPAYEDLFKETNEYFNRKFQYVDKAEADNYFDIEHWWIDKP